MEQQTQEAHTVASQTAPSPSVPPKPPRIPVNLRNIFSMIIVACVSSLITYLVIKPPVFLSFAPKVPVLTTPTPTSTPVPTPVWKTYTKTKVPIFETNGFSISYPPRWQENIQFVNPKGNEDEGFTFRLYFRDHIIRIQQGPVPHEICIFESDTRPEGMVSTDFRGTDAVDIVPLFALLKRVQVDAKGQATTNFLICQNKRPGKEHHESPTTVGYITYETPLDYTPALLLEMDEIVKTLRSF